MEQNEYDSAVILFCGFMNTNEKIISVMAIKKIKILISFIFNNLTKSFRYTKYITS